MSLFFAVISSLSVGAADPCDPPRIRDLGALSMAMTQDKQVAQAFQKAAGACAQDTDACDQARLECSTLLAASLKAQISFDEGAWLRDMLMPYLGQMYVLSRSFGAGPSATDTTCTGEPALLNAAAMRRLAQATKRQAIYDEYPKYAAWVNATYARCREQANVDQQKQLANRSEAERLAAAAAAAKLAEEARQKSEDEARQRAEAQARAQAEAVKKQQQAQEAAQRRAEEDARQRAKADEQARLAQEDAVERAEREKKEAEKKAARAEEERLVRDREAKLAQARQQKSQLVADAKADLERATADAAAKQKAAMVALEEHSPAAGMLATEAANAERSRADAEKRFADAKVKADRIEIDESSERARGSLGLQVEGGYGSLSSSDGAATGPMFGVDAQLHFGFWGTAPADGLASGLEVRINGRFLAQAGGTGAQREIEGRAAVRWFFGRIGLGAAAEYRAFDSTLGTTARSFSGFGLGPALGVAFVDTPTMRVGFNIAWLPLVTNDLLRVVADLEVAWRFLLFGLGGGTLTDPISPAARVGFFVTALAGVRLGW